MDTSSSGSNITQLWDSFSDARSNQTGFDFSFPWTNYQINTLKMVSSIRLCIILLGITANTYTFYLQIRHKLYRRPSYIFAITLTTADVAYSCGFALEWFSRQDIPGYIGAIVISSATLTILSTTAVAVDRYLALHAIPLKYKQFITVKKYVIAALFIVMLAIACGGTISIAFPYTHSVLPWYAFAVSSVFTSATMILYVALGCVLSKSNPKLQLPPKTKLRRIRQTRKILLTFSAIILTNFILCFPNYIFGVYVALQSDHKKYSVYLNVLLANTFYTILVSNYTVDALIFMTSFLRPYLPRLCHKKDMRKGNSRSSDKNKKIDGTLIENRKDSVYSVSAALKSVPALK